MNLKLLFLNHRLFSLLCAAPALAIAMCFGLGQWRPLEEMQITDILGEGSIAIVCLLWQFFILTSRPPGKVTYGLLAGLSLIGFSSLLDWFDEFVSYPNIEWISLFESLPAGLGMLLLSHALYLWHHEQLQLNQQLYRREQNYRDHQQLDHVTQLYCADYLRHRLSHHLIHHQNASLAVLMLDIDHFDQFNRQHGVAQGDRFLKELAQLLVLSLRDDDLVCRYAGDRFVILLPDTNLSTAEQLAEQIRSAVQHFAFKPTGSSIPVFSTLTVASDTASPDDKPEGVFYRLGQLLEQRKHRREAYHV